MSIIFIIIVIIRSRSRIRFICIARFKHGDTKKKRAEWSKTYNIYVWNIVGEKLSFKRNKSQ